ncbi:MAG: DUF839 domain-containing protein [Bacteroidota bacterium]|nr:DUF839 domain-containing protein [Bacteroidota bacterium]
MRYIILFLLCIVSYFSKGQQHISSFTSVQPASQTHNFVLPQYLTFHFIIKDGDSLTDGSIMPTNPDFTGYVPINGSSKHGYLCINSESNPGGVTVFEIKQDSVNLDWEIISSNKVSFASVNGTRSNCSGGITPWGTMLSCEEAKTNDGNFDGYNDYGWVIEVDPASHTVINQPGGLSNGDKLWALGNFNHENASVHSNKRTVYMGIDAASGYMLKFVADTAEKLYSGKLYAYKGSKNGNGKWVRIKNATASDCNNTNQSCIDSFCTTFAGIEDVEYNTVDGKIYLAVKSEDCVYRFSDDSYLNGDSVHNFETFVGNTSYNITHANGTTNTSWGTGNDNLCFDDTGNLWVFQDGSNNYIWLVQKGHTQASPKVKIFAKSPAGSEPTGITFTPNYKYMFMSIQHPSSSNITAQFDVYGNSVKFDKAVSLVVSRDSSFIALPITFNGLWATLYNNEVNINWQTACENMSYGFFVERSNDLKYWSIIGMELSANNGCRLTNYYYTDKEPEAGLNYYRIRQTDMDGSEFISETVVVNYLHNKESLYPMPCEAGSNIKLNTNEPIQLIDAQGKYIMTNYINNKSGYIQAPEVAGIYYIILNNGKSFKLIVR